MTPSRTALLARLREAKAGSRELSDAALRAAGWTWLQPLQSGRVNHGEGWTDATGRGRGLPGPDVTTSLDAITGEVEARGWKVVYVTIEDSPEQYYVVVRRADALRVAGTHVNLILALCIAFLSALDHD